MTFSVFKNINRSAGKSKLLDALAVFCARYLLYLMILFLLIFSAVTHNWSLFFIPLLSGLFAAFIFSWIIYIFYREHRPAELKIAKVLIPVPKNPSFPSRHTAFLFGISFYLFFYNIPLAIFFVIGSCLVGIARVFCGVHWFHDILAGIFVGFMSALMVYGLLAGIKFI